MRSPYVPTDLKKAEFLTELLIRELWDGRHQLIADFWIYSAELARETGGSGIYLVPLGNITNYISSPRLFWAIVPRDGPEKWASVGHDAASHGELVDVTGAPAYLTKQQTDDLFRELMKVPPCDKVPGWKRWLMYRFVKRWGTGDYGGKVIVVPTAAVMSDLFPDRPTTTPIGDAIDKLGTSGDGLSLDLGRDTSGKTGVSVEGTKTFGTDKTWSASGAVQWVKAQGYAVLGKLRWTPK